MSLLHFARRVPAWGVLIVALWGGSSADRTSSSQAKEPASGRARFDSEKLGQLGSTLSKFVNEGQVTGLVAMVGDSEGVERVESLGARGVDSSDPMREDALFRIASMTKPMTALGIMILVDEGKLSIDDPVEKHLPEFRGQMLVASRDEKEKTVSLRPPARPITLHDLLTHTSGLPAFPEGLSDIYFRRNHSLAEMTLAISQRPLDFEPGAKWAYCNPGIDTLGRVIEVVSGESFESFMAKRLFEPLGMKDTTFYPTPQQLERLAALCDRKEEKLVDVGYSLIGPSADARHPIPAGGLYSTAEDISRLCRMMLNKGDWNGQRIVSEASVRTMTQNQTGTLETGFAPGMSFGLGWALVREPQGVTEKLSPGAFGHGGAFGTQYWIDPERGVFVILLIQRVGLPNADASEMRRELQRVAIDALK